MKKSVSKDAVLIPDDAICVFRGEIFDVFQWPQAMFDGSTKTFEMLKRPDTVQIIAVKDGRIVVIEDQQPGRPLQIHLPGGRTDDHDVSWLDTAKRELREETGMRFRTWRHLTSDQPAAKIEWFTPIFLATDFETQEAQALDTDGEQIKVLLMPYEKIRQLALSEQHPMLSYLAPLFARADSIDRLLALPTFAGVEIDR